jgi:hypothetical protein
VICSRCQGLMVEEELRDWAGGSGYDCFDAWRCLVCGEIVDQVIRSNRRKVKEVDLDGRMKQARHNARTIPVRSIRIGASVPHEQ